MDKVDLEIVKKLLANSRLTYRALAEETNLSVSAIHKRMQNLIDNKTINAFIAQPSIIALKSIWVMTTGVSNAKSMDLISKELGSHESIYFIAISSGKFLYIVAYLRDISEMQEFSSYVSKTSKIKDPTMAIINVQYITTPEVLSKLDYQILKVLNRESRKSISEIADLVGSSSKTVKKHLDYMVENQLARFTIEWTPKAANNFITIFHINLSEDTDKQTLLPYLYKKYVKNLAYCLTFSNLPNKLTMHTWAKNSMESQKIQEELQTENFEDIMPHIVLFGNYYDCWVDKLLRLK